MSFCLTLDHTFLGTVFGSVFVLFNKYNNLKWYSVA